MPPALGRLYKDLIPGCHLVFVYAAGHAIAADRPEAFTEVVGDFLERHEAFVVSRAQTVIHP
jgi:pimeloyl-ACP methyl ester carboxylesterase